MVCVCVWVEKEREREIFFPLLIRPPILSDLGPTLMSSFNLLYLLKALSPNIVTLRIRTSTYKFEGHTIKFIARSDGVEVIKPDYANKGNKHEK